MKTTSLVLAALLASTSLAMLAPPAQAVIYGCVDDVPAYATCFSVNLSTQCVDTDGYVNHDACAIDVVLGAYDSLPDGACVGDYNAVGQGCDVNTYPVFYLRSCGGDSWAYWIGNAQSPCFGAPILRQVRDLHSYDPLFP